MSISTFSEAPFLGMKERTTILVVPFSNAMTTNCTWFLSGWARTAGLTGGRLKKENRTALILDSALEILLSSAPDEFNSSVRILWIAAGESRKPRMPACAHRIFLETPIFQVLPAGLPFPNLIFASVPRTVLVGVQKTTIVVHKHGAATKMTKRLARTIFTVAAPSGG